MTQPTTTIELPDNPQGMLELMRTRSIECSPFTRLLGVEPIRCWAGEAELVIPIRNDWTQQYGTVHGGVLGAAADIVCGWAAASRLGPLVTSSYNIHFLEPGEGNLLRAIGRVIRAGPRSAVTGADLFMHNGQKTVLVATALATVRAIPR